MRVAVAGSIFPLARSLAAFKAMPAIDSEVIILSSLIWRELDAGYAYPSF
jgi:hypothetical protein